MIAGLKIETNLSKPKKNINTLKYLLKWSCNVKTECFLTLESSAMFFFNSYHLLKAYSMQGVAPLQNYSWAEPYVVPLLA